jgi:hypothetical protein
MGNWRSHPRTGKSQVVPWVQHIQARMDQGATMKQVYDEMVSSDSITLGYRQFVRYVHELADSAFTAESIEKNRAPSRKNSPAVPVSSKNQPQTIPNKLPVSDSESPATPDLKKAEPRPPMTPADFRKIREEFDRMDLNALVSGRGIVFREK